jgi:hypothetical protein
MAHANIRLINAIRSTAKAIESGDNYMWGHMGSCNCGHLAQELTSFTREQIHQLAMESKQGDWSEHTISFCDNKNLPMDIVIAELIGAGLEPADLRHLEWLSDPQVLFAMKSKKMHPSRNNREDVVLYMRTWATLLEEQLLDKIKIDDIRAEFSEALRDAGSVAL